MTTPSLGPIENVSHVRGDTSTPLWQKTVWQVLEDTAASYPDRDAAVFRENGERWTWTEFKARCDQLAAGLRELGLQKGDRIGIWSPNLPEWVLTQFATARLGLVLVNINPAYRIAELDYALNKVGCKALILADAFKSSDYLEMMRRIAPEIADAVPGELDSASVPALRHVIRTGTDKTPGMHNFGDVMALGDKPDTAALDAISASLEPDEPINIQFTSGTTGAPKGATLTHTGIVNNARYVVGTMNFTEADRLCIPVPLYHCFGMVMGTLGCATTGATMVFPGPAFEPLSTLQTAAEEHCTALYGVPTMFVAMLEHESFGSHDLSALRTGIMAGAPCPIEVMKQVIADMNMSEVTIAYGMTETSPVSFQSHVDDPLEKRVSTVGRIHPHVECKVIDDQGQTAPIGQSGELCTRGYSVMRGYWDDDERTAESIDADGGCTPATSPPSTRAAIATSSGGSRTC